MPQLSDNFHSDEFRCNCGECEQIMPPRILINELQGVRTHYGVPITVNSGHRCSVYNASVGGARSSQHLLANACDFTVHKTRPSSVHKLLIRRFVGRYGIGSYDTFTHLDIRRNRARWSG